MRQGLQFQMDKLCGHIFIALSFSFKILLFTKDNHF